MGSKKAKQSKDFELSVSSTDDIAELAGDVCMLINETRSRVAATVNIGLTLLYWKVGRRISQAILQSQRAEYGKQVFPLLSAQLTTSYGRGWSERTLAY